MAHHIVLTNSISRFTKILPASSLPVTSDTASVLVPIQSSYSSIVLTIPLPEEMLVLIGISSRSNRTFLFGIMALFLFFRVIEMLVSFSLFADTKTVSFFGFFRICFGMAFLGICRDVDGIESALDFLTYFLAYDF